MTTLVLLPGLDGTGAVFDPLLNHLPQSIEPLVVRYPADKPLSFQEHVEFAKEQLPADEPFVLLAESFSGPIGLQILAEPPTNMLGVIFVATFARYPKPFLLDVVQYLPQSLLLSLFCTTPALRFFCLGSSPASRVKHFQQAVKSVQPRVLSQRLKILAELPPPPEALSDLPSFYLQASHDHLVPERAASQLQKHIPGMCIAQLPGPHIIVMKQPEASANKIAEFIDSVTGQA